MQHVTGRKIILNQQQAAAARAIFGDVLGDEIITEAKKQTGYDDLIATVKNLKAAADKLSAGVTRYELARGADLQNTYYQSNGKPPTGLTANYFGGGK